MTSNPYEFPSVLLSRETNKTVHWQWPSLYDAFALIPIAFFVWAMNENVPQYVGYMIASAQHDSGFGASAFEMLFQATQALRWALIGCMGIAVTLTFTSWASVNASQLQRYYRRLCWLCVVALVIYLGVRSAVYLAGAFPFLPDVHTLAIVVVFFTLLMPLVYCKLGYVKLIGIVWNRIGNRLPAA